MDFEFISRIVVTFLKYFWGKALKNPQAYAILLLLEKSGEGAFPATRLRLLNSCTPNNNMDTLMFFMHQSKNGSSAYRNRPATWQTSPERSAEA